MAGDSPITLHTIVGDISFLAGEANTTALDLESFGNGSHSTQKHRLGPSQYAPRIKSLVDGLEAVVSELSAMDERMQAKVKWLQDQIKGYRQSDNEGAAEVVDLRRSLARQERTAEDLRKANGISQQENAEEIAQLRRRLHAPPSRPISRTQQRVRFETQTNDGPSPQAARTGRAEVSGSEHAADEQLITLAVAAGKKAFQAERYKEAVEDFQRARTAINGLPDSVKTSFDDVDLDYHLAASTACNVDISVAQKEKALSAYVKRHASDPDLDAQKLAHVEHFLAQAYIELGKLDKAHRFCEKAFGFRSKFGPEDQRRHESAALLVHIDRVMGDEVAARVRLESFPEHLKQWLNTKYSHIQPPANANGAARLVLNTTRSARPAPPVGLRRAPTWTLATGQLKEATTPCNAGPMAEGPGRTNSEPRPKVISEWTRRKWLSELGLQGKNSVFEEAIVRGDAEQVAALLGQRKRTNFALHLAALFGEVEIATLLIRHGSKVGETCKTVNGSSHCKFVRPLNLAIGARQHAMIRFLDQQNAKFGLSKPEGVTTRAMSEAHPHSAAPRWLLSPRWLKLTKCDNPQEVNTVVDTLLSLRWNIDAPLNGDGDTMLDIAYGLQDDDKGFKEAVVRHLRSKRARSKKQLAMSRAPTLDE
ncbi:hypothetical protein LTR85_011052 [Meristemomyces frigidus]|nr:hypothetical protein LTR85_011052 [Meristemomyces frigidus]